ncbi:hypothetical protein DSO57_1025808 [Entomophthora muscae]|uniref:Uncharacterized protein n=1 Tax=Entomophthora muscae TaxID=34485 RepID=A0ACC2TDH4_9FUNG|nr:hypothetical protein DSO57_1025808 [Entomophthora muscae]
MVDQTFADSQQLDHMPSRFKAVVAITHEKVPFSVRMGNIQVKLSGPIMAGHSHNVCGETLQQLVAGILIVIESFLIKWDPDCLLNRAIFPEYIVSISFWIV